MEKNSNIFTMSVVPVLSWLWNVNLFFQFDHFFGKSEIIRFCSAQGFPVQGVLFEINQAKKR